MLPCNRHRTGFMDWLAIVSGIGISTIIGMAGVGSGSPMKPLPISVFQRHRALAALLAGSLPGIRLGARLTKVIH